MSKKIIDADLFWKLFKSFVHRNVKTYHGDEKGDDHAVDEEDILFFTEKTINELATPAPVYDEKNIYAILDVLSKRLKDEKKDADFLSNKVNTFINGYNRAILIAISTITNLIDKATPAPEPQEEVVDIYKTKIHGTLICDILKGKIAELERACSLRGFDKHLPVIHARTSLIGFVNFVFSGNYKKYDGVEFAKPQESIFNADGWCFDLKAIPKNTLIDLAVQCVEDGSVNREVNYLLNDNGDFYSSDYEHYLEDTYEFGYAILAWRTLPTLPISAN